MKAVQFHPGAFEEAREAALRYKVIRAGLGADFWAELATALLPIREIPLYLSVERGSIWVCPLHRFPYAVFFEDLPDQVWVACLATTIVGPDTWHAVA